MLASTLVLIAFAILFLPTAEVLGFVPLPRRVLVLVAGITVMYVVATELLKRRFYRHSSNG